MNMNRSKDGMIMQTLHQVVRRVVHTVVMITVVRMTVVIIAALTEVIPMVIHIVVILTMFVLYVMVVNFVRYVTEEAVCPIPHMAKAVADGLIVPDVMEVEDVSIVIR